MTSHTKSTPPSEDRSGSTPESRRDGSIDEQSGLPIMSMPREGLPVLVDNPDALADCIDALAAGHGPVAIDTERAQVYRYSAKAYLLQFRREGSGTWLVDPIAFETSYGTVADLSELGEAIASAEWIIHAATQDLPCMVELGLRPTTLFDTELAGRLLGLPKVGLGRMIETYCGYHLLKEHSTADWSKRPLPADWIAYAALDVELLIELRNKIEDQLTFEGKLEWARQEFAHLVTSYSEPAPPEPWRHLKGIHDVHTRRGLALARELWIARDEIAWSIDKSPIKVLPDTAITELAATVHKSATKMPSARQLSTAKGFKRGITQRYMSDWVDACKATEKLSDKELPLLHTPRVDPPKHFTWSQLRPGAWKRWTLVRPATNALAAAARMPAENLISPRALRALLWDPLPETTEDAIRQRLADNDVRPWQIDLVAPVVLAALNSKEPTEAS